MSCMLSCTYISYILSFSSQWDLSRRLLGYHFAYILNIMRDLSQGSEISQLTPFEDLSFITSSLGLQHRRLTPMDLSISVMMETRPNTLISYALFSFISMLMLHAIKSSYFCFHVHTFNTYLFHNS
jgi:hypothetical protein